jgi:quinoprotein glucose dehydrogenase
LAHGRRGPLLWLTALLIGVMGVALAGGGAWLAALGGSWYYVTVGMACLLSAALLAMRRSAALWLYALVVAGSLAWAYWEAGLDWWPLAARGGLVFALGVLLLLPWTRRPLFPDSRLAAWRGGGLALAAALLVSLGVAGASILNDPHSRTGSLTGAAAEASLAATGAPDVPPGEWHAYGRTGFGQRYSPLSEITPANVDQLAVASTYRTGDLRASRAIRRKRPSRSRR